MRPLETATVMGVALLTDIVLSNNTASGLMKTAEMQPVSYGDTNVLNPGDKFQGEEKAGKTVKRRLQFGQVNQVDAHRRIRLQLIN
jgi:hypothetical protein